MAQEAGSFPPAPPVRVTDSAFLPAPTLTVASPETVYIVPPTSSTVSLPLVIVPAGGKVEDGGSAAQTIYGTVFWNL